MKTEEFITSLIFSPPLLGAFIPSSIMTVTNPELAFKVSGLIASGAVLLGVFSQCLGDGYEWVFPWCLQVITGTIAPPLLWSRSVERINEFNEMTERVYNEIKQPLLPAKSPQRKCKTPKPKILPKISTHKTPATLILKPLEKPLMHPQINQFLQLFEQGLDHWGYAQKKNCSDLLLNEIKSFRNQIKTLYQLFPPAIYSDIPWNPKARKSWETCHSILNERLKKSSSVPEKFGITLLALQQTITTMEKIRQDHELSLKSRSHRHHKKTPNVFNERKTPSSTSTTMSSSRTENTPT